MMKNFCIFFFFVFILFLSSVQCDHNNTFSVLDFGAKGDGDTDDTQAFENAWTATCSSQAASPTMHVPYGSTFLLHPVIFDGPCKAVTVNVKIDGTLIAPSDPSEWKCDKNECKQWIAFYEIDGLHVSGSGTINAQGSKWWDCKKEKRHDHHKKCERNPTGFVLSHCNNVKLRDLSFRDSPQMHIALETSTWVNVKYLTVTAPWDSPNTDGIHIQNSQNITISQSHIGTGDDCISIGDGTKYLNISNITCGPGHGISIGSLGADGQYEVVEHVNVNDVDFRGTSNGVRIKTWQGGKGFARNIVFHRIRSFGARNPIIIDQFYCDHQRTELCNNQTSAVQVSNVTYSHIFGTSGDKIAMKFECSESLPCKDIFLKNIILHTTQHNSNTTSLCKNVQGRVVGNVFPRVHCLA